MSSERLSNEDWLALLPEPYKRFAQQVVEEKLEQLATEILDLDKHEEIKTFRTEYIEVSKLKSLFDKHKIVVKPKF